MASMCSYPVLAPILLLLTTWALLNCRLRKLSRNPCMIELCARIRFGNTPSGVENGFEVSRVPAPILVHMTFPVVLEL